MNTQFFLNVLQSNYEAIKNEFNSVASEDLYTEWPQKSIYNQGWNVFGLRFQAIDLPEAHEMCPVISGLISRYDDLIDTLGFSVLNPGTVIHPHKGITDTVLRCHMGISVPEGDCAIRVGDEIYKWQNGVAFVFDDTLEHEAWNKTDQKRIVMLMDLNKDVLFNDQYMA